MWLKLHTHGLSIDTPWVGERYMNWFGDKNFWHDYHSSGQARVCLKGP